MPRIHLSTYSRTELENALQVLKSYRLSLKQIGKRAFLTDPENLPVQELRVEYAPSLQKEIVEKYARICIEKSFPSVDASSDISYKENPRLSGGIRVFFGDDLVDISLEKFLTLLNPVLS